MTIKPAGFSKSALSDSTSVAIVNEVLNRKFTYPNITHGDKMPNCDGYIFLHKKNDYIGKIEVQVKTLREGFKTPSLNVKLQLLAYARICQLPFLIIAVDQVNKQCYWFHLTKKKANDLINTALKKNRKTTAINFDSDLRFPLNSPYDKWSNLVNEHISALHDSEELKEKLLTSQDIINDLKARKSVNIENPANTHLNRFLEQLNSLFNREFIVLKNLFRGEFWKFGITIYGEFSDTQVTYSLFSIDLNDNTRDIFYYPSTKSINEFRNESINWTSIGGSNPFISKPDAYAFEKIKDYMDILIDRKLLWTNNDFLKNEFLFFLNDSYKFIHDYSRTIDEIDLEILDEKIEQFIEVSPFETKISLEFPESERNLFRARDYIQEFRLKGNKTITRLLPSKGKLQDLRFGFNQTQSYSTDLQEVLTNYINALNDAYSSTIHEFFPFLIDSLVKDDNVIEFISLGIFKIRGTDTLPQETIPSVFYFKVKDKRIKKRKIIFIPDANANLNFNILTRQLEHQGKVYQVSSSKRVALKEVITSDNMPIRKGVYKLLKENLIEYFKTKMTK